VLDAVEAHQLRLNIDAQQAEALQQQEEERRARADLARVNQG